MSDHRLCTLETRRKNEVVENLRLSLTTNKLTLRLKTTWKKSSIVLALVIKLSSHRQRSFGMCNFWSLLYCVIKF